MRNKERRSSTRIKVNHSNDQGGCIIRITGIDLNRGGFDQKNLGKIKKIHLPIHLGHESI